MGGHLVKLKEHKTRLNACNDFLCLTCCFSGNICGPDKEYLNAPRRDSAAHHDYALRTHFKVKSM